MASSSSENKKEKKVAMKPSRGWVITINNPVIPLDMYLQQWHADGNIVFGCGQTEVGENGTRHHQAYIVTKVNDKNTNGFGIKWLKENIHTSAHFEPRQGTHEEARDYCTLEEYKGVKKGRIAGPWTVGEWSPEAAMAAGGKKGGATVKKNVDALMTDVKAGMPDIELMEKYPALYLQYYKAIERVRLNIAQEQPRPQPYVVVLYGETGTGKSHDAQTIVDNNGGGFTFRRGNGGNMWADGYDPLRHPVVVFDEMDGGFMPYRQLLRVCDKWPLVLDTKGGCVNFTPSIIVFTSSKHPKEWYSVESVKDTSELMRRLTGQYGAIIHKTIPFQVQRDAGPDLKDVIDLLMTGDLVDQMSQAIDQDNIKEDVPPNSHTVDLTCDEDIDDLADVQPEERASWYEGAITECCNRPEEYCECDYAGHQEDFDADAEFPSPSQKYSQDISPEILNRAGSLKRRGAEFFITPPPHAPASEFKKLKLVPGQARLDLKKVNDDDDIVE
ncbi:MAG: putative viral replication protein [Circoviridae sp.]|nr:MAG: putative viral replication protein [Circoviridae sp.]